MNKRLPVLALIASLLVTPAAMAAGTAGNDADRVYLRAVMTILRTHIDALVHLTEGKSKYGDNVVRHAVGVRQTMGLFDHLDWSPAVEARFRPVTAGERPMAKQFETLAWTARKRARNLERAATVWLHAEDREDFLIALNAMMDACNQCHTRLLNQNAPIMAQVE